jgi:S-adenosylmethionine/arginine decarboxylase-like enzyme
MHEVDGGKTARIVLHQCETLENGGLSDRDFNELILLQLCDHLRMTQIGLPFTQAIPPGLSTGLVIAESHLFIHTWPEDASVRVVIDSCVDFDHNETADWLKEIYGAQGYSYHIM